MPINLHLWLLLGGVSFLGNFQSLLCWYPSSTYKSTLALCISKFLFCPWHDLFDDVFNVTSMDKRMAFPRSQHLTFLVPCLPGFFHGNSWQGDKVTVSCAEGDTGFIYKGELKFESLGPKKLQSWWNKNSSFRLQWGLTLPENNSSHLKICGWKMDFLLEWPIFRGYLSFREGTSLLFTFAIPTPFSPQKWVALHLLWQKDSENCWSEGILYILFTHSRRCSADGAKSTGKKYQYPKKDYLT